MGTYISIGALLGVVVSISITNCYTTLPIEVYMFLTGFLLPLVVISPLLDRINRVK